MTTPRARNAHLATDRAIANAGATRRVAGRPSTGNAEAVTVTGITAAAAAGTLVALASDGTWDRALDQYGKQWLIWGWSIGGDRVSLYGEQWVDAAALSAATPGSSVYWGSTGQYTVSPSKASDVVVATCTSVGTGNKRLLRIVHASQQPRRVSWWITAAARSVGEVIAADGSAWAPNLPPAGVVVRKVGNDCEIVSHGAAPEITTATSNMGHLAIASAATAGAIVRVAPDGVPSHSPANELSPWLVGHYAASGSASAHLVVDITPLDWRRPDKASPTAATSVVVDVVTQRADGSIPAARATIVATGTDCIIRCEIEIEPYPTTIVSGSARAAVYLHARYDEPGTDTDSGGDTYTTRDPIQAHTSTADDIDSSTAPGTATTSLATATWAWSSGTLQVTIAAAGAISGATLTAHARTSRSL